MYASYINIYTVRSFAVDSMTCALICSQSWHLYANLILCSKDSQIQSLKRTVNVISTILLVYWVVPFSISYHMAGLYFHKPFNISQSKEVSDL